MSCMSLLGFACISQWKKSTSAKNWRGSRKHLLGNIGEKIGKPRQALKNANFVLQQGQNFLPNFFPIFPDFFSIFSDFCRFFAMFDFLKKLRFFRAEKSAARKNRDFSVIFSTMILVQFAFLCRDEEPLFGGYLVPNLVFWLRIHIHIQHKKIA